MHLLGISNGCLEKMRETLAEIRQRFVVEQRPLDAATAAALRADGRPGAQAILQAVEKRRSAKRAEGQRLRRLLRYERSQWASGLRYVAGVDEAGMSPLAGPVAAAAVIFPPETRIADVDDSKKLDARTRAQLATEIKTRAVAWSVSMVEVEDIDRVNIYWAGILAMRRAIEGLACVPQHVLSDARRIKDVAIPQQAIVRGDSASLSIAAASILAKTARDALMEKLEQEHPGYGFARHKGYPVPEHLQALRKLGASAAHRRSFAVVRDVLGLPPLPPWPRPSS